MPLSKGSNNPGLVPNNHEHSLIRHRALEKSSTSHQSARALSNRGVTRRDVVDGLEAVLYVEDLAEKERAREARDANRKLCEEPAAGHVHAWVNRRDGSWCACGAIRFAVFG